MLSSYPVSIWNGLRRVGFGLSLRDLAAQGSPVTGILPITRAWLMSAVVVCSCPAKIWASWVMIPIAR
jgi:hypothetical protein